jgi:hydroxyacylglutathione hydrolase
MAPIEILQYTLGLAVTNGYIVGDKATGEALLIDPVENAPLLVKSATNAGYTIKLILATHGHFDHVLASKELKELTGAPFYIHRRDQPYLDNLPQTGMRVAGKLFPEAAVPDHYFEDESETVTLGDEIKLETIFTPGHAPGHVCFYMRDHGILFCGDLLFQGSVGRTDLPGGDHAVLLQSVAKLFELLPEDTRLLPGHGGHTNLGHERLTNPFLQDMDSVDPV